MIHPLYRRAAKIRDRLDRAGERFDLAVAAFRITGDETILLSELIQLIANLGNLHGECAAILEHLENKEDPS